MALGLTGCGPPAATPKSSSTTSSPSTTAPAPITTTAVPTATAAVLAAYRAEWAAYEQALTTADPLDPALKATMVNPLLHQVEGNLVTYNQEGIIGQGAITLNPHVASIAATTATILDCPYSASLLVYKKTGKQVPPVTKPEHDAVKATLVLDGSTWKVKRQDITEGSCPAGY